jgi:hypothetical protein
MSECGTLALHPEQTSASAPAPSVWYCKACSEFLPASAFYPSSIARRIHSCKRHMDIAVGAAVSRARVANPQRSKRSKVLRPVRRRYGDDTPTWATQPAVVQQLLDAHGWHSVLSGLGSARAVSITVPHKCSTVGLQAQWRKCQRVGSIVGAVVIEKHSNDV